MTGWQVLGIIAAGLTGAALAIVWLVSAMNDQERVER